MQLLRLPAVLARVGVSRSTLYEMKARGDFPEPVQIGARAVGWRSTDVDEWLESRVPRSDESRDAA